MTKIVNNMTGRVKIRIYEKLEASESALHGRTHHPIGDAVELSVGENEVDDEFAATWVEQNATSSLLVNGQIVVVSG